MKKISLTDFIDVVSRSGASKATKVSTIKNRKPYSPATDFYKGIREAIVENLTEGRDKRDIDLAVSKATSKRKSHYEEAAKGFKKWTGRKDVECFDAPKGTYGSGDVVVNVNPEIGIYIDEEPYLVKLYFKADKLPKNHVLVSTHLMKECLEERCPEGTKMAVLDVKRGKMIEHTQSNEKLDAALKGELAYIQSLWESV